MTKEIKNMIANINAIEMSENKMKDVSSKAEQKGKKAKCERGRNREMTSREEFVEGAKLQGMQVPLEAGKGKKMDSLLNPPERKAAWSTP